MTDFLSLGLKLVSLYKGFMAEFHILHGQKVYYAKSNLKKKSITF